MYDIKSTSCLLYCCFLDGYKTYMVLTRSFERMRFTCNFFRSIFFVIFVYNKESRINHVVTLIKVCHYNVCRVCVLRPQYASACIRTPPQSVPFRDRSIFYFNYSTMSCSVWSRNSNIYSFVIKAEIHEISLTVG